MEYRPHHPETTAKDTHTLDFVEVAYIDTGKRSVDGQMAHILDYMHGHHGTRLATLSASEAGIGALKDIKNKLDSASDALLRMEDESGKSLDAGQMAKVECYSKESQRVEKVLQQAEHCQPLRIRTQRSDDNHCMT
ncbi:MAG TPA: hypothetical protein VFT64_11890 [Rickettsiales bacterium]|nr:hypothetical protein [Rickettsiales bacterium]